MCSLRPASFSYLCARVRILGVLKIVCCCRIKPDCRTPSVVSIFTDSSACVLSYAPPLHYTEFVQIAINRLTSALPYHVKRVPSEAWQNQQNVVATTGRCLLCRVWCDITAAKRQQRHGRSGWKNNKLLNENQIRNYLTSFSTAVHGWRWLDVVCQTQSQFCDGSLAVTPVIMSTSSWASWTERLSGTVRFRSCRQGSHRSAGKNSLPPCPTLYRPLSLLLNNIFKIYIHLI